MVALGTAVGRPATAIRNIGMNKLDDDRAHPGAKLFEEFMARLLLDKLSPGAALYSHPVSDEGDLAKNHHPLQRRSPAPLKEVKRLIRRILRKLGLKM